jgi:serine/threonine protein kinase
VSDLKSGLKLGPKIGGGFFGDVHKGSDDLHGDVAVKILRQFAGEPNADWTLRKEDLLKEGQRLSQAAHENVVRVHHIVRDESEDNLWLVMELCQSGLQAKYNAGPMGLLETRKACCEVALGLQSLHSREMLHRDIKPGNILISRRGIAQLGDFGLVTDNLILGYGSEAGYSDHIAPEVWATSLTSKKSDIWALGMTAYRLLHGAEWYSRLPASPRTVIANGGFAASLPWLPHIPDGWRRAIRKMMHDDPNSRCQSAGGIISSLANVECEPDWDCRVDKGLIRWSRVTRARRFFAVLESHSARRHEWHAWSEPIGAGNRRSLGRSAGIVGYGEAEHGLRAFFFK